ncbi:reverse transcriptase domain-containing protein [Tanacetum coccineum]
MSTRSTSSNLFSPLRDPESLIRRRNLGEPSSLFDFEEVMSIPHNNMGPPPAGPPSARPAPKLRNEITKFEQKLHESLFEAWERYNLSIDRCLNHNMLLVTQIDTFYNGLTLSHRDTINAAAGGTFMQKTLELCYELIENMTAYHNHWDTLATRDETSRNISSTTTESPEVVTKDKVQNTSLGSTAHVQPLVIQDPILEPEVAPKSKPKPSIPYPSRINDKKLCKKANNPMLKFLQIFQRLHFNISFADALLYMPKFASTFKSLLNNKEKLFELASTLLNENCLAMLLKKLPEKLGDPSKFLTPCDFPELDKCLALADLDASINLIPLSIWKNLLLSELTPARMILELADRSTTSLSGIAEDVFIKVGKFHFPTNFVVVDYVVDPRVPLILGRPFLRTACALIDVYGEELTL